MLYLNLNMSCIISVTIICHATFVLTYHIWLSFSRRTTGWYCNTRCLIQSNVLIWIRHSLQASIASTHRHVHVQIVVLGSFLHYSWLCFLCSSIRFTLLILLQRIFFGPRYIGDDFCLGPRYIGDDFCLGPIVLWLRHKKV